MTYFYLLFFSVTESEKKALGRTNTNLVVMKNIADKNIEVLEEKKNAYELADKEALEAQNNVQTIESKVGAIKVKGQLEETFLRFPHIAEQIFEVLDVQSLSKCQEVSKCWKNFIYETNPFFRSLQVYTGIPKAILKKSLSVYSYQTIQKIKLGASIYYKQAVKASIPFEIPPQRVEPKSSKLLYYLLSKVKLTGTQSQLTKLMILYKMDKSTLIVNDEKDSYKSALWDLEADANDGIFGNGYTSFRKSIMEKEGKWPWDTFFSWIPILHLAITQNHLAISKLIFEKVQEIHPIHKLGKLMLQPAISYGHKDMCEFILNKIQVIDLEESLIQMAQSLGQKEICTLFENFMQS